VFNALFERYSNTFLQAHVLLHRNLNNIQQPVSGVYFKSPNATYLGGHSVKCIGWGVERNVSYWLMMNSWNSTWGDKGYFKIRRGTNECQIEDSSTAGVPEYYK